MFTVVTGPPCSGKSTYVRERVESGDIVIDFDVLAQALGSLDTHDHPEAVRWVAQAARRAAIDAALGQHRRGARVWLVQTNVNQADALRYTKAGAHWVTLSADRETLKARAEAERPARWQGLIEQWAPIVPVAPAVFNAGRNGYAWRKVRAAVLATSRVCSWCGHDGADAVDHVVPISRGGDPLNVHNLRPIHGNDGCSVCGVKCNAVKGYSVSRNAESRSRTW